MILPLKKAQTSWSPGSYIFLSPENSYEVTEMISEEMTGARFQHDQRTRASYISEPQASGTEEQGTPSGIRA